MLLTAVWFSVRRIVRSPFGRALIAIRENEDRARHLGYDVNRFLLRSFVISGGITGLAGGMFTTLYEFVTPDILIWLVSGEAVIVTLLGGIGTLGGPVIGSLALLSPRTLTEHATDDWRLIFGPMIMLVVLFAPRGLHGIYQSVRDESEAGFDVSDLFERLAR